MSILGRRKYRPLSLVETMEAIHRDAEPPAAALCDVSYAPADRDDTAVRDLGIASRDVGLSIAAAYLRDEPLQLPADILLAVDRLAARLVDL